MQSFLAQRRIYKQLEKQIVIKHDKSENILTHERRYWYRREGGLGSEDREPNDGEAAAKRREHGHRTIIAGPTLEPRHSTRQHLEREGDVETADYNPSVQTDPYTINTRDTLGGNTDMMVTGIVRERPRHGRQLPRRSSTTNGVEGSRWSVDEDEDDGDEDMEKILLVTYEGDTDPMDPHNWSFACRAAYTTLLGCVSTAVLFSSTIDASVVISTKHLFNTSFELQTVPTAVFLIGLGMGSMLTAPLSELFGRNPLYIVCLTCFMLFDMGAGLAQNVGQRSVCRGLAGLFGSAPLVCAAASLVDLWSIIERVYAFPYFAILAFLGPLFGPLPGNFINQAPSVSWRWVDWLTIIVTGFLLALVLLFLPETYSPIRLHWKAKQLRRLTGDDRYRAPMEFNRDRFTRRIALALSRPFILCTGEPIILFFSLYLSVIFIILYTFSSGYVAIFEKANGLSQGQAGVAFLAIMVGVISIRHPDRGLARPAPESNLYMAMFGAPAIPIGLFWMGWTASPSILVWSPIVASVVFGFGILCVFVSAYQYVAAAYEFHPGSALASLQMFRLTAAGVMAVIADIMYNKLGTHWTLTVLGGDRDLLSSCSLYAFHMGA
ncbi:hypothetical protein N7450_009091 [Penicillium hetheringtonii]|uniref:Major facilitator superfamily (MFS) profile domain-containing protein n=1 Tax=Penicillium hetheringtonii TaxID=911720 RepID=A0AAD6DEG2_9EURO|nr:hypothetical protein N7450_009091 [Penicillium hetheringtonii]